MHLLPFLLATLALTGMLPAQAQPSTRGFAVCSSDMQPVPRRLVERFLNADCETCWRQAQPDAGGGPLAPADAVMDWVIPGQLGDEAPLAGVALRDGAWRLQAVGRPLPERNDVLSARRRPSLDPPRLRVAHGSALLGHVAVSVEMTPARGGPWVVWLVLTEQLPAGTEGSPVARDLVRGSLRLDWSARAAPGQPSTSPPWRERRVMQLPEGTQTDQLRLTAWAEDAQGRIGALARSHCPR